MVHSKEEMLTDYYKKHPVGDRPKKFRELTIADCLYTIYKYQLIELEILSITELRQDISFHTDDGDVCIYDQYFDKSVAFDKFSVEARIYADKAVAELELEKYKYDSIHAKESQIKVLQREIEAIKQA